MRTDLLEKRILVSPPCGAVAQNSDLVAGKAVLFGKIAHMPEDPSDGGPEAMDDAQGSRHCRSE